MGKEKKRKKLMDGKEEEEEEREEVDDCKYEGKTGEEEPARNDKGKWAPGNGWWWRARVTVEMGEAKWLMVEMGCKYEKKK